MHEMFVSYSRVDQPYVEPFVRSLQEAGIRTWFDLDDLLPGQKWEDIIEDRIADSRIFLPVLSESSAQRRGYFQSEQVLALRAAMRVPSDQIFLMPTLLGPVAVPREMRQYHAVDHSADGGLEKIAAALSEALEKSVALSSDACSRLRELARYHLKYEAKANESFVSQFLNPELPISDSIALLERLTNSRDAHRLQTLLDLRANASLAMAEHRALDIAIDHVQQGRRVESLWDSAVLPEKLRIMSMRAPGPALLTQQLVINKYVRYTSRRDSQLYAMAQAKLLELLAQGIQSADDEA